MHIFLYRPSLDGEYTLGKYSMKDWIPLPILLLLEKQDKVGVSEKRPGGGITQLHPMPDKVPSLFNPDTIFWDAL